MLAVKKGRKMADFGYNVVCTNGFEISGGNRIFFLANIFGRKIVASHVRNRFVVATSCTSEAFRTLD